MSSFIDDVRDGDRIKHIITNAHSEMTTNNIKSLVYLFETVPTTPNIKSMGNFTDNNCYENKE